MLYTWSDVDLKEMIQSSSSWTELVRRCGYKQGRNTRDFVQTLRQKIESLQLSTEHFKWKRVSTDLDIAELVRTSKSWSELSFKCGGAGRVPAASVRRQIHEQNLSTEHFRQNKPCTRRHITSKLDLVSRDTMQQILDESRNWREVARRLGYAYHHNNNRGMIRKIQALGMSTSHLQNHVKKVKKDLADVFVSNSNYDRSILKRRLLTDLNWPYECNKCKNVHFDVVDGTVLWMNEPVTMQLEHKNGINNDNRLENLELLCPLCHSQTSTYGGKNSKWARAKRQWLGDV